MSTKPEQTKKYRLIGKGPDWQSPFVKYWVEFPDGTVHRMGIVKYQEFRQNHKVVEGRKWLLKK